MRSSLARVWMVDLLVAVRVLPLQFASLLIITLPVTLPRLLALQLANPASVVEGAPGPSTPYAACGEQLFPPCIAAGMTVGAPAEGQSGDDAMLYVHGIFACCQAVDLCGVHSDLT